jgi:molecular chaperone GrpE
MIDSEGNPMSQDLEKPQNPENESLDPVLPAEESPQDEIINISEEDALHADEDIVSALKLLQGFEDEESEDDPGGSKPASAVPPPPQAKSLEKDIQQINDLKKLIASQKKNLSDAERKISEMEKKLAESEKRAVEMTQKAEELNGHWVRVSADYQNYQKRAKAKFNEFLDLERGTMIKEFLPVIENLKRALMHQNEAELFREGVQLILKQMEAMLEKWNVKEIPALEQNFDPALHDAIDRVAMIDKQDNLIVNVVSTGYFMGDRVLTPARVIVNCLPIKLRTQSNLNDDKMAENEIELIPSAEHLDEPPLTLDENTQDQGGAPANTV